MRRADTATAKYMSALRSARAGYLRMRPGNCRCCVPAGGDWPGIQRRLNTSMSRPPVSRTAAAPKTATAQAAEWAALAVTAVPTIAVAAARPTAMRWPASPPGKPDLLYMDAVEGVPIERSALVRKATIEFDLVRSDALARNASRDLILKVAEQRWNT